MVKVMDDRELLRAMEQGQTPDQSTLLRLYADGLIEVVDVTNLDSPGQEYIFSGLTAKGREVLASDYPSPRKTDDGRNILVTLGGECFEANYIDCGNAEGRDGALYYFKLLDLVKNRGLWNVSLFRSWMDKDLVPDYEARLEAVRLNVLRRAFDSGAFSFDTPVIPGRYYELRLRAEDFQQGPVATDFEIRRFLKLGGYWLGFKYRPHLPGTFRLDFGDPKELSYLGTTIDGIARNLALLTEQGYFQNSNGAVSGKPTSLLIEEHEGIARRTVAAGGNVNQTFNLHGPNSRVNLNSTDNSVNTATVSSDRLFLQLREAARSIAEESGRVEILMRLEHLERAQGSGTFLQAYQNFVACAANHMTIFAPFIPALTAMLSGTVT